MEAMTKTKTNKGMVDVGNDDWGEVVVNIGKARPKVIVASMALPKNLFAPRTTIFRDLYKKSNISKIIFKALKLILPILTI